MAYNRSTLWRLYQIGGPDLALRYAEISNSRAAPERETSRAKSTSDYRLKIRDIRFSSALSPSPAEFATSFTATTWPIACRVDLESPWEYTASTYTLVVRRYGPDGDPLPPVEDTFETVPGSKTFSRIYFLSDTKLSWRPGSYRVEIEVDGQRRTAEFTITNNSRSIDLASWRGEAPLFRNNKKLPWL